MCEDSSSDVNNWCESPPPPYSEFDNVIKQNEFTRHTFERDIYVTIKKDPCVNLGLVIFNVQQKFGYNLPVISNITKFSPASKTQPKLKIRDKILQIDGISTALLKHKEVIALFQKASDQLTMSVRRNIHQETNTFNWYKFPFSSVSPRNEEVSLPKKKPSLTILDEKLGLSLNVENFTTFKTTFKTDKRDLNRKNVSGRSLSVSSIFDSPTNFDEIYSSPKVTEKAIRGTSTYLSLDRNFRYVVPNSPEVEGKLISDAVDARYMIKRNLKKKCDSEESISSSISSFTSSTTSLDQVNNQSNQQLLINCSYQQDKNNVVKANNISQTIDINQVKGKFQSMKDNILQNNMKTKEKSVLKCESLDNTFLRTIWLSDCKKLGLKLGGGSVSAYGDTNIFVTEIKKNCTGANLFEVKDQILEIGGVETQGMNIYEANKLIKSHEGNYIEFKIYRPNKRSN